MKCPKCQSENPDTKQFCGDCGTQLIPVEESQPSFTKTLETPVEELTRGTLFAERYEIIEELGTGGMGRVYRAEDTKIGLEIALKLLNPEIAYDIKTLERFQNELKTTRMITHRNVCRTFDIGETEGIHFITMEYVSGEDLKSFIRRSGKLDVPKALSIAMQVCEGLSEAHRLDVVHRDLKSKNVMIDKDGNARIMDFGIARSLRAQGMTAEGMIIGTPEYMSPEQAEAKEVDHRSDIYSLGVVLYEMVTGKLPFAGETALSVAIMHKTQSPTDPREHNPKISDDLSRIILKCMEKDRDKRYQNVEDLLSELRDSIVEIPTKSRSLASQLPAFLLTPEDGMLEEERPLFVAREKELKKLSRSLDKMLSGQGQVAFVVGEAGDGKTALVEEFARRAQEDQPDLIVANGKCNAHTGIGEPYLPFREVLSLLTGDIGPRWEAGFITRKHASRLWNFLSSSVQALIDSGQDLLNSFISGEGLVSRAEVSALVKPDILGKLKKIVEYKKTATPDPSLQQIVFFDQYTSVVQSLAKEKPLLIILDDLQWSDAGSVSLLFHLGRRIKGCQIMLLGAFRAAEVAIGRGEERHPLEQIVNEFKRDFGDIEIEVSKAEGLKFVDAFIDTEPNRLTEEFRDNLFRQTKGHPLFTIELLRGMQEQGVLFQDEDGNWIEGSELDWKTLPVRVEAVIKERISRLENNLREVLTLASIEGEEFTAEIIAHLMNTDVNELIRLLSHELDKKHHLVSAKGMKRVNNQRLSQYIFQHILFQKYLYNNLDTVERSHWHEEIGNALETLHDEQVEEIAGQLARHFKEAGIAQKAIRYFQMAGDRAKRLFANAEALNHYARALAECQKVGNSALTTSIEVARSRAFINISSQDLPAAISDFERMLSDARKLKDRRQEGLALAFLGHVRYFTHEFEKGESILKEALAIADEGFDDVRLLASSWLYGIMSEWGRHAERKKYVRMVTEVDEKVVDPHVRLGASIMFWDALYEHDFDKAIELNQRTRKDAEKCGIASLLLAHQLGEALARGGRGEYEKSLKLMKEIRATCERIGEEWVKARYYNCIGWIYGELQDIKQALQCNIRGIKEAQEAHFPNPECESNARLNVGDNQMELGRLEEAEEQFRWVEQVVRDHKPEHLFMLWKYSQHLFHSYGEFWLIRGDCDKAKSYADECLILAEESKSWKYVVKARRLHGQIFLKEGKLKEAEQDLLLALEVAQKVRNPKQLWLTHAALGELRRAQGYQKSALQAFRNACSVIDGVASGLTSESLRKTFLDSPRVLQIMTKLED